MALGQPRRCCHHQHVNGVTRRIGRKSRPTLRIHHPSSAPRRRTAYHLLGEPGQRRSRLIEAAEGTALDRAVPVSGAVDNARERSKQVNLLTFQLVDKVASYLASTSSMHLLISASIVVPNWASFALNAARRAFVTRAETWAVRAP